MRALLPFVSLVSLVGCSGPRVAREETVAASRPAVVTPRVDRVPAQAAHREVVTVIADGAPLAEVLDSIGRQVGWNIVLEPGAHTERVDLHLRDIGWRDALSVLSRQHHLEVEVTGDRLLWVTQPPRVTMSF